MHQDDRTIGHPGNRRSLTMLPFLIAALISTMGCSHEARKYPVQGVVRFLDGKVLQNSSVEFEGSSEGEQIVARGKIGGDGSFTLGTGTFPGH